MNDYLSLLSWQNCKISSQDFKRLEEEPIENPENLISLISSLESKQYLMHNKYWWKKAEQDYLYCQKRNYRILNPSHEDYPKKILNFYDNVPIFLILGDMSFQKTHSPITFVGSRSPDDLVLNWMDFYITPLIKEKPICLVSGGARGIDQKIHKIAIRSQVPTLCFLPSGLDFFYPESLHSIKSGILNQGGAFISCFPPWEKMRKAHFHTRNAFMSAYSDLVVILQAQKRSGTMLTARKSLELGTPIAVLPGSVLSTKWAGNLQLIYDGAYIIRDSLDLSVLIESLTISKKEHSESTL